VVELKTEAELAQAVADGALIVKTDTANPARLHLDPKQCRGINAENFHIKIVVGGGKEGRYYRTTDPAAARQRWSRLRVCATCRRLDPFLAAQVEALMGE
jgi:hypothetical protein